MAIANSLLAQYVAEHPRRDSLDRLIDFMSLQVQLRPGTKGADQFAIEIAKFQEQVRVDDDRVDLSPRPLDALFRPLYAVLSSSQRGALADELRGRAGENLDSGWLDHFSDMARSARLSREWEPYDPDAHVRELAHLKLRCDFMEAAMLRMIQIHPHPCAFSDTLQWATDRAIEEGGTGAHDDVMAESCKWSNSINARQSSSLKVFLGE